MLQHTNKKTGYKGENKFTIMLHIIYSRVHISSDTAFLKILKKPSIVHCCYGGIGNDFDFFGPDWSLRHENLEKLIKTVT